MLADNYTDRPVPQDWRWIWRQTFDDQKRD